MTDTLVTVGTSGVVYTSTNAVTWTSRTSGVSYTLYHVASMAGILVAVGAAGGIIRSTTNGETWSSVTSGISTDLFGVAQDGSQFIAVGQNGKILTSPTGETWTAQTSGLPNDTTGRINKIRYNGSNLLCCACGNGIALTSPDAVTWTQRTTNGVAKYGIGYGAGLWVLTGDSGVLYTSPDGTSWTSRISGVSDRLQAVSHDGTRFISGGSPADVIRSTDGITWTGDLHSAETVISDFVSSSSLGLFIGVGSSGKIETSPTGQTWTEQTDVGTATLWSVAINSITTSSYSTIGGGLAGGTSGFTYFSLGNTYQSYSAVGGSISGGSPVTARTSLFTASSGAISGGTSVGDIAKMASFFATGGSVSGGISGTIYRNALTLSYTTHGGSVSGGYSSVSFNTSRSFIQSGGHISGGVSEMIKLMSFLSTGGSVSGGTATIGPTITIALPVRKVRAEYRKLIFPVEDER